MLRTAVALLYGCYVHTCKSSGFQREVKVMLLSYPVLQHHQYVLQASVLKGSWPVAESAWGQVEVDPEKEDCEEETL